MISVKSVGKLNGVWEQLIQIMESEKYVWENKLGVLWKNKSNFSYWEILGCARFA